MVTEAHVKLRRTGSGKARTDSSGAGKPVHELVAIAQETGPRGRAGAGRDLRRKRSIWPIARGRARAGWAAWLLLASCTLAAAACVAYVLVTDRVGGALLQLHCFLAARPQAEGFAKQLWFLALAQL